MSQSYRILMVYNKNMFTAVSLYITCPACRKKLDEICNSTILLSTVPHAIILSLIAVVFWFSSQPASRFMGGRGSLPFEPEVDCDIASDFFKMCSAHVSVSLASIHEDKYFWPNESATLLQESIHLQQVQLWTKQFIYTLEQFLHDACTLGQFTAFYNRSLQKRSYPQSANPITPALNWHKLIMEIPPGVFSPKPKLIQWLN